MLRRLLVVTAAVVTAAVLAFALPAGAESGARAGAPPAVHYVALGDSYSSGLGAGSYDPGSGSCDRSSKAYPVLWARAHAPASFTFAACAEATTSSVISGQLSALSHRTTLVSITIGGNDVRFRHVMEICVLFSTSACVDAIGTAEAAMTTTLPRALDRVLSAIAAAAPNARVVVLGYPELYDLGRSSECIGLSTTDRTDLNEAADRIDTQIRAAAQRHRDTFADVRSAFRDHEICDTPRWLHAVDWLDLLASYHPTAAGQAGAYYPVFAARS